MFPFLLAFGAQTEQSTRLEDPQSVRLPGDCCCLLVLDLQLIPCTRRAISCPLQAKSARPREWTDVWEGYRIGTMLLSTSMRG